MQAARFGVSRADQDAFALASHHKAAKATADGLLLPEITPVDGVSADSGIRGDATLEKLSSLKPAFVKPHGTHTVGYSLSLALSLSLSLSLSELVHVCNASVCRRLLTPPSSLTVDPRL